MDNKRVFISAINLKTSGISGLKDLHSLIHEEKKLPLEEFSVGNEKILLGETIPLDTTSLYYPSKSNEKVMRTEVIASTVCVGELIKEANIPENLLEAIPLYISTGICFERQDSDLDWVSKVIEASTTLKTIREKNIKVNQLVPPLISLRTLTNSASSFVAQYCRLAGNNSTFGITSQSAVFALREAFKAIQTGESDYAVAGGASRGGLSSFYMFKNFTSSLSLWKECACASFVLLESDESLKKSNRKAICEVTDIITSKKIPDILNPTYENSFSEFHNKGEDSDLCIFGGAFREAEHYEDEKCAKQVWDETFSLFPFIGNFGAAGMFMNIASSVAFFNERKYKTIDCVDRDPFNRESLVRLKFNTL